MDPITLIVTALAAGAASGIQDTASAMVKDAYARLKSLVKRRLGGDPGAEMVIARHEEAPETWQAPLKAELARTGADGDDELIAAAKALLDLWEISPLANPYATLCADVGPPTRQAWDQYAGSGEPLPKVCA